MGEYSGVITNPILDEKGVIVGGMVLTQDITAFRQAALLGTDKKRDLLLRERALNATDTGIVMVDALAPDLPITYVNEGFTRLTGYDAEEVIGRNCRFLQGEDREQEAREEIRKAVAEERRTRVICRNYRKDGTMFWNELTLYPVRENNRVTHLIGIQHDVTERIEAEETRKSLEESLFHSRKMEALGLLSAGIAHEFNNLLGGIMNYAQLLIDSPEDGQVESCAQKLLSAGMRGRDVTAQLLSFARIEARNLAPCALDDLLDEVIDVVKASLPARIQLVTELNVAGKIVLADQTMLHGALFNLCANAIDAMKDSGVLTIKASEEMGAHIVKIHIQDTGAGIDPALLSRIFDPFFTTKGIGRGTGLGLAYTRATVEAHGGKIHVESRLGQGTTSTIELPTTHQKPAEHKNVHTESPGHKEKILIIEDDENILKSATSFLASRNFIILPATCATDAIEIIGREKEIDLILTDLHLPDKSGPALLKTLRELARATPLLVVSATSIPIHAPLSNRTPDRNFCKNLTSSTSF